MKADDLTGVVLNYRTPDKTLACLMSMASEGICRVVLVENSGDGGRSLDELQAGLAELAEQRLDVLVIDEGRNLGFAAGVNRALSLIQARFSGPALLLNSDAKLTQGSLAPLLAALESGADVAAPEIDVGSQAATPWFNYHSYLALLTKRPIPGSFPYIAGACMLLSRSLVRCDLFDEDFFFYGEDVDLGARLGRADVRCVAVKNSRITHEIAGSSQRGSLFYEYHINRGHWLLARKLSGSSVAFAFAVAGRLLVLPLRAIYRCVRLRTLAPLKGAIQSALDVRFGRPARLLVSARS